jgi:hypothetical protein
LELLVTLWTPPGVKAAVGRDLWPPPDVVKLKGGALLKRSDDWPPLADIAPTRTYRGPHELIVLVSLDDRGEPWGTLLHVSLSVPRGYPDWDLIYAVTRAFFGEHVDAMMPIPREEAFIHGAFESQRQGRTRQVFHVVEMPQAWPKEDS